MRILWKWFRPKPETNLWINKHVFKWWQSIISKDQLKHFGLALSQFDVTENSFVFEDMVELKLKQSGTRQVELMYGDTLVAWVDDPDRLSPLVFHLFLTICSIHMYGSWWEDCKNNDFTQCLIGEGLNSNKMAHSIMARITDQQEFLERLDEVKSYLETFNKTFKALKFISFDGKASTSTALDGSSYDFLQDHAVHVSIDSTKTAYFAYSRNYRDRRIEEILQTNDRDIVYLYLLIHWFDYFGIHNIIYSDN